MKKFLMGFLFFMLILSGCSSTTNDSASTSNSQSGQKQEVKTVKLLTHWDAANSKEFEKYIAEYEAQNPGVKIELQTVPFGELLKKITTSQLADDGPDIYHIYAAWLPELAKSKAITIVPDAVSTNVTQNYADNIKQSVTYEGKIYGYPTELTTYALNYNKRLFEEAGIKEPPKNWDELKEYAKKLTKIENGKIVQQGFGVISGWDSGSAHPWLTLLQSNGGDFLNGENTQATFNSQQGMETIQLYKDLVDMQALNPEMSPANASTNGGYQNNFELEKTAMIIMANWWKGGLQATMKDKFANVATAPIPVGPSGSKAVPVFYSWLYTVNSKSNNQDEAWKFLTWLNSPKADDQSSRQGDWLINQGIIPSRTGDQEFHKNTLEQDAFLKTYVNLLKDAKPFPNINNGVEVTAALQKQIEAVLFGQTPPEQAIQTAAKQIDGILSKK